MSASNLQRSGLVALARSNSCSISTNEAGLKGCTTSPVLLAVVNVATPPAKITATLTPIANFIFVHAISFNIPLMMGKVQLPNSQQDQECAENGTQDEQDNRPPPRRKSGGGPPHSETLAR